MSPQSAESLHSTQSPSEADSEDFPDSKLEQDEGGISSVEKVQKLFEDKTTVMIKNIPCSYTSEELQRDVKLEGFGEAFDFFYLVFDFKTKRNRGYAFLNFHTNEIAKRFVKAFHGKSLSGSKKILEISPAKRQGLKENVKNVERAEQKVKNRWFRPMVCGEAEVWRQKRAPDPPDPLDRHKSEFV